MCVYHTYLSYIWWSCAKTPWPSSTERMMTWSVPRCISDANPMHTRCRPRSMPWCSGHVFVAGVVAHAHSGRSGNILHYTTLYYVLLSLLLLVVVLLWLVWLYIYIYIYNPHLGWIPPLICCFPPNVLFHYSFTIKMANNRQNYGQDLINPAGDTSCDTLGVILGVILGIIHFLSKRDPQKSD